jgi:hypothetical protein
MLPGTKSGPDGTIVVVTGAPESSTEPNPWLADLKRMNQ